MSTETAALPKSGARGRYWKHRLFSIFAVSALVSLAALGSSAWLVPYAIATYAPKWLKETTGRELTVADASFNPFSLKLDVSGAALKDGARVLAALDSLHLEGSWKSLANAAWTVNRITLKNPQVNAHADSSGSLDWARFLDALPKSERSEARSDSVPRIVLTNVEVRGGALRLTDERVGMSSAGQKRAEIAPLTFKLDRLSTLPRDRGDYALDATLNDQTRIQWKGRIGANPIESAGDVSITNLPLNKLSSLANVSLPIDLAGTAALQANYSAAIGTDFQAFGIGGGSLRVDKLTVVRGDDEAAVGSLVLAPISVSFARIDAATPARSDGRAAAAIAAQTVYAIEPFTVNATQARLSRRDAALPSLELGKLSNLSPIEIDVVQRKINIPKITLEGLSANFDRAKGGEVVFPFATRTGGRSAGTLSTAPTASAPIAPSIAAATPPTTPGSAERWQVSVGELTTVGAALGVRDASFAQPQRASAKLTLGLALEAQIGDSARFSLTTLASRLDELAVSDDSEAPSGSPVAVRSPWLRIAQIRAAPFSYASDAKAIELPKIEIVSPQLALSLDKDGLDIAKKLAPAIATTVGAGVTQSVPLSGTNASPVPQSVTPLALAGLVLTGGQIALTDQTLSPPLTHTLQAIRIGSERLAFQPQLPINATLAATLASGGTLKSTLTFDQKRGLVQTTFALENLALTPFSAYLNKNTKLKITKGEGGVSGKIQFVTSDRALNGSAERFRFDGAAAARDIELTDETTNTAFAQWAALSTTDAKVASGGQGIQISLADLLLDQPRGKIIIGEDRSVNLTRIAKENADGSAVVQAQTPTQRAPAPLDAANQVSASVSRIQVTGGDIEFADLSLRPQFGTRISDLSGLIVGLSTAAASRAEVAMEGKVDQFGLARLTGTIAPFGASEFTDLKAIFRNLEMANLTPYSGKFAGRTIESGKLSLDLDYKIEARKLKGENQLIIDNIRLGDRVDSPDATSLPLDLAIALLRDSNGMIELGIPVQGSLDDPQFSYGSLIWKAIANVLTKIATAPFRALGALLGGNGEAFEAVIFEPGEARLLPPEREKLAKLTAALEKRPQLKLTIEPRFDTQADRDALADNILKIEIGKRAGLKPPGPNEPLIISLTDPKVQAALDELALAAGEDAAALRARYLPPPANAIAGLIQNARERVTESARTAAAEARGKFYPELYALLKSKQSVPSFAFEALATLRGQAIANTITGVSKFDATRVSVAAPAAAKAAKEGQVPTQLALSVK